MIIVSPRVAALSASERARHDSSNSHQRLPFFLLDFFKLDFLELAFLEPDLDFFPFFRIL
jgi:hypothetical protein